MSKDIIKAYVDKKELTIKKKSGVYGIFDKIDRKIYIGASKNIRRRFNEHISSLRNNKHTNPYLQESFNKHEERDFDFMIKKELKKHMRYFHDYFKSFC